MVGRCFRCGHGGGLDSPVSKVAPGDLFGDGLNFESYLGKNMFARIPRKRKCAELKLDLAFVHFVLRWLGVSRRRNWGRPARRKISTWQIQLTQLRTGGWAVERTGGDIRDFVEEWRKIRGENQFAGRSGHVAGKRCRRSHRIPAGWQNGNDSRGRRCRYRDEMAVGQEELSDCQDG